MLLSRFVSDKMLRVHFSSQLKIQNEQWVSIACQLANVTVCLYCDVRSGYSWWYCWRTLSGSVQTYFV